MVSSGFKVERVIIDVALLVATGKVLEELLGRAGVPAFVAYVIAGFILGPSVLGLVSYSDGISVVASLALFFIALYAGLEVPYAWFTRSSFKSTLVALISFSLTFIPSLTACILVGLNIYESLVVSLIVSVTALPVAAAILSELGLLSSRIGALVIGVAVVTDILVITSLGVLVGIAATGSLDIQSLSKIAMGVLVLASMIVMSHLLISRLSTIEPMWIHRLSPLLRSSEAGLAVLLVTALLLGALSELLGLHFIVGVFLVGLLVDGSWIGEEAYRKAVESIKGVTISLLLPIFASTIGLIASTTEPQGILAFNTLKLIVVFTLLATTLRYTAGYIGARLTGLTGEESRLVGVALTLKGAMDKIVLLAAYQQNIITQQLMIPLITALVITTIVTPATLKLTLNTIPLETRMAITRTT